MYLLVYTPLPLCHAPPISFILFLGHNGQARPLPLPRPDQGHTTAATTTTSSTPLAEQPTDQPTKQPSEFRRQITSTVQELLLPRAQQTPHQSLTMATATATTTLHCLLGEIRFAPFFGWPRCCLTWWGTTHTPQYLNTRAPVDVA